MQRLRVALGAKRPPRQAVLAVALVCLISGLGTITFWARLFLGVETCTQCVPFGLSTYRFLYWPLPDCFLAVLCLATAVMLVRRSRFVFLVGVTLGLDFIFMALLALYMGASGRLQQPTFLTAWFAGWGTFLVWFLNHWRRFWGSRAGPSALPTRRKRAMI